MKETLIWQRMAEKYADEQATEVVHRTEFKDKTGHSVVLATDGTISASFKGAPVNWNSNFSGEQIEHLRDGRVAEVGSEVLRSFRAAIASGSVRVSDWTPNDNHDTVMEEQLSAKRKGTDKDVKERLLGDKAGDYKRSYNEERDDKVREDLIEEKREGTDDKAKELLLDEDAGLYGRHGTDDDVKERLIADARMGSPDEVFEDQLEAVRKKYGPEGPLSVMQATASALGRAVVSAGMTPEEAADAVETLAARRDLTDLVWMASAGNERRTWIASRLAYHGASLPQLSPLSAVLDELGRAVTAKITAADLVKAVRVAAENREICVASIDNSARKVMASGVHGSASPVRSGVSEAEQYPAALATQAERRASMEMGKPQVQGMLRALAFAALDNGYTPQEIWEDLNSTDREFLVTEVELARSASSAKARETVAQRREFWAEQGQKFASVEDLHETLVGYLADSALANKFTTSSVAEAVVKTGLNPEVAERWLTKTIAAVSVRMGRQAAIQVTDGKTTTKRLVCRAEDLGGLDPKSADFEDDLSRARHRHL